ncbi:MAG TPA: ATP-dependent zinc metalloprotease FtsH [Pirellulales bacterium]|jgi:cell division protease FtsH|nr:ATP-dependent zinc metalloprotease FtsH [Pirellulales bacterium]
MKNDREPLRKSNDKKASPINNNVVWFLLVLGVLTLLAVSMMTGGPDEKLQYSDLLELVKVTGGQGGKNYIDVHRGSGEKVQTVRFSDPTDIKLGSYEVTGKVIREVVGEPASRAAISFQSNLKPMDDRLAQLLEEKHISFDNAEGPAAWRSYVPMLVLTGLCVAFIFYMMRRLGGAGSPMAFGRSRGKMYAQEDLGVTFEDVAGIDEAVDELREVVEFLRTPEKYQILGGRIPKGLLLVGPPGTGKTLLAKAIAGEAGVPFFSLSGSDFVEMFVGVGAARVRDMFQQAEAKAPCIIFIDELDALGKTRGSSVVGGHDEREQTLNALLVEMDGFDSNNGVIVLAASNRPETLDPALLRPGRFDRHVLVDRPDVRGREAILKVHVQEVKLAESVNLKEVAAITSGFVGADLANLINEAALLAARKGKSSVGMDELNEGVERVTAGLEKRQRIIHEEEKLRVAYHESGHALVAYSLPNTDPVHKVSIIPRGLAALGYTLQRPEGDRYLLTQGELESRIQVLLAGTCAEELIFEDVSTGAQNDLERANAIARSMVMDYGMSRLGRVNYRESSRSPFLATGGDFQREHSHSEQTAREIDEEVKRIIDESMVKVRHILDTRVSSLNALSARLIEKEVVDSDELKAIIEASSAIPLIVPGTQSERKRAAGESIDRSGDQAQAESV